MEITTELIKSLRDETGVSVMQCKKALEEAKGDKTKALSILKEISKGIREKKGDRTLGSGALGVYLHSTGRVGAMVLLSSETDFVSKNEEFRKLAYDIAMHVAASNPEFLTLEEAGEGGKDSALLEQPYIKNPEVSIRVLVDQAIQKFGERIEVSKFIRFSV